MPRLTPVALLLAAAPAFVFAQASDPNAPPAPSSQAYPAEGSTPSEPPPTEAPPPPQAESQLPPPPQQDSQSGIPPPASEPAGQWVYTGQYGWLWMPYDRQYTYIPGDPQVFPEVFVYYPVYGWRWVVAPWVYGWGPAPYWGVRGPRFFVWYAHPWFRVGGYWGWGGYRGWGYYRGWIGPRVWGARGWVRAPAYYRTGVGWSHGPRVVRPAPSRRQERPGRERRR